MTTTAPGRGHEIHGHTADEILAAWGPTRETCLEEVALALVETVATVGDVGWAWHHRIELSGDDADILVALLEEVIYHLDVDDAVPVRVHVVPRGIGVVAHMWLTDIHRTSVRGAAPKGVSYTQLTFREFEDGQWRCTVTVDV